ncbi:hypothetical protein CW304_27995 [Bacillus sp. UFRGS-B20]|nr:hypothetical protein CW304_27995 [Bacillus sp. UFRGS-B20]
MYPRSGYYKWKNTTKSQTNTKRQITKNTLYLLECVVYYGSPKVTSYYAERQEESRKQWPEYEGTGLQSKNVKNIKHYKFKLLSYMQCVNVFKGKKANQVWVADIPCMTKEGG